MGEIWIPEAERLGAGIIGGAMDTPGAGPRTVWHTTESGAGDGPFKNVGQYLITAGSEPHILYDPTTDRLGQYGPLNQSARALRNAGTVRTNRTGKVCIQIEVLARAATPFTDYWQPGPNFRALLRAIRSWDVPDEWPAGRLAQSYSDDSPRSLSIWQSRGGHYGHSNVPGNDHWDPGAIDIAALLAASEEDDMPLTQDDLNKVANAVWRHTETNAATGRPVDMGAVMAWMDRVHNNQSAQIAASQAAITALATQLGQHDDVDTATIVAAVEQAIADAVVQVDVNITGTQES